MVVGVPNSGKSTIINAMVKKAKAVTGDRPGVTRGKQWLSIDNVDFWTRRARCGASSRIKGLRITLRISAR